MGGGEGAAINRTRWTGGAWRLIGTLGDPMCGKQPWEPRLYEIDVSIESALRFEVR